MKNFMDMMKQAQQLQARMQDMQAELEQLTVEGQSGGGMVTVTLNGKGAMTGLRLDPQLLQDTEAEILEDLVVAAHNDAKSKLETAVQEKMREMAGDLPLPPGMKLF